MWCVWIAVFTGFQLGWRCYLALPGEYQTIQASELVALLIILAMVRPRCAIAVVVENMYVHEGVLSCARAGVLGPRWRRLWDLTRLEHICISIRWVKSHVDEMSWHIDVLPNPVSDIIGNSHADALAENGGALAEPPQESSN